MLLILIILLLSSCFSHNFTINKENTYLGYLIDENDKVVPLLNTDVLITTTRSDLKEENSSLIQEELFKIHKLLDSHHYYLEDGKRINNLKVLNDSIDKGKIIIDPILFNCLKDAIKLSKLTKGYFNFTLGNLSDIYNDKFLPYESIKDDPDINEIKKAMESIIPYESLEDYIILNENEYSIELKSYNNHHYQLDLGAIGKGYALDQIYLEKDSSYLINAGSSSIKTHKVENEDVSWNIGARIPDSKEVAYSFNINEGNISTSGDDENFYILQDGTRRHHILNPYTGQSENYYRIITIISNSGMISDCLSTALFNIEDRNEIINMINEFKKTYNIEIEYCFLKEEDSKMKLIMSKGFKELLLDNSIKEIIYE